MGLFSSVKKLAGSITGGDILSTGASLLGGFMQNSQSASSAKDSMAFQERMSNTSYQRAADDMEKAGLNRILAATQGGASTPGGATYNPSEVIGKTANSALAARAQRATIASIDASTAKTQQDTHTSQTAEYKNLSDIEYNRAAMDKLRAETALTLSNATGAKLRNSALGYSNIGASNDAAFEAELSKMSPWARKTILGLRSIIGGANSAKSLIYDQPFKNRK